MRFGSIARSRVALLLLIAGSLFSNLLLLTRSARQLFWKPNNDYAAYQQQKSRLEGIQETLAARRSRIVGYGTDRRPGATEYYLTQFILAPVLVADDPARPLIIGNYHQEGGVPPAIPNARILQTTHGGIVLIERSAGQ